MELVNATAVLIVRPLPMRASINSCLRFFRGELPNLVNQIPASWLKY